MMREDRESIGEDTKRYLHWITAIACKLWLENRKEAIVLFEAVRRLAELHGLLGIETLSAAFVNPMNDFAVSSYPWALIHVNRNYLVRLIVNRCDVCGKDTCPCIDLEDCDRVEIEGKANSLDDALKTLAIFYLSYFFSNRAYEDGISLNVEIADEYDKIKDELGKNILINIGPRDEKKLELITQQREKKHRKAHEKLVELVLKDYRNLHRKVDAWKSNFKRELKNANKEDVEGAIVTSLQLLPNLYSTLSRIDKNSKDPKINEICKNSLDLINNLKQTCILDGNTLKIMADKEEIKELLGKLQNVLKLLTENADKLVKIDIKPGALVYDNRLAYGIRSLVAITVCLDEYLKRLPTES